MGGGGGGGGGGAGGKKRKKVGASSASSTTSGIHAVKWRRVVLDEAHEIRNRKTAAAKAAKNLRARFRWCLTGTPLQNRASDIQSLFEFLKLSPLSDHTIFHRAVTRPIRSGDVNGLARLRTTLTSVCLRRTKGILGSMLPSKTITIHSLDLQNFTGTANGSTTTAQWDVYKVLADSTSAVFRAVLDRGGRNAIMSNYSQVLEMILRLRQAACSLDMVPVERLQAARNLLEHLQSSTSSTKGGKKKKKAMTVEEASDLFKKLKGILDIGGGGGKSSSASSSSSSSSSSFVASSPPSDVDAKDRECAVCLEELSHSSARILRGCGHCFCQDCLTSVLKTAPESTGSRCPLCRSGFSGHDIISVEELQQQTAAAVEEEKKDEKDESVVMTSDDDAFLSSSLSPNSVKIAALIEHLERLRHEDPSRKSVVFSHFTSFLDRIGTALETKGTEPFPFGCIRGGMSISARMQVLEDFETNSETKVLLVSTRAGGVGINLTSASQVFMMDPWWNFSVEAQAIDRVHRIGQTRAVEVVRYVCSGTIEEKILEIQKRKDAIASGAMGKLTPEEARNARFDDVQSLLTTSM